MKTNILIAALNKIIARKVSSPTREYYHGTCTKFLRNILKQGMLPDTKEGTWKGEDPEAGWQTATRKSYKGSYWTISAKTSIQYAEDSQEKFGGNQLIVFGQLQPKSALPDEDDLVPIIEKRFYSYPTSGKLLEDLAMLNDSNKPAPLKLLRTELYDYFGDILSSKQVNSPQLETALENLFIAAAHRKLSYVTTWDYEKDYRDYVLDEEQAKQARLTQNTEIPEILKQKSSAQAEKDFREAMETLLKIIRRLTVIPSKTIRITEPVGFSGKNKITGIVEIIAHNNEATGYKLKIHYGKIEDNWLHYFQITRKVVEVVN